MRIMRYLGAVIACAALALGGGAAYAGTHHTTKTVHPTTSSAYDDANDILAVQTYCAGFDGHGAIIVDATTHRSNVRTTNLTYDIAISWTTSGTPYTGYASTSVSISPGGGVRHQAWLTTDGPQENDFLVNAAHLVTTASNITVNVTRHSDGEQQTFVRAANITTACT